MKYLHIMTNDKFNTGYIKFIEENFDMSEHLFVFWSGSSEEEIKILDRDNIYKVKNIINKLVLIGDLYKSKKIYLHGLHNKRLNKMLYHNKSVLKKCNWLVWGGDLHEYEWERVGRKEEQKEIHRRFIIKRFGAITTYLKEEWKLTEEWYGFKGRTYDCLLYPSNTFMDISGKNKEDDKLVIQVGNSAVPRNNHMEVLKKLEKHKSENIEIVVPLSYGNEGYAKKVAVEGQRIFGDKFKPLLQLIPYEEYLSLLSRIDIAIFNHKKHQAMGNIIKLIGMGKTVYLNSEDFITGTLMHDLGLKVLNTSQEIELEKLSDEESAENIEIVKERFSLKNLVMEWEKIFND